MNLKIDKEEFKVIIAYITVCIIWGSTYLAIRIGVKDFPPELFAGIRFLIAGSLVLFFAKLKKLEFPNSVSHVKKLSIVGLFLLLGGNGLVVWAEQWVHSGIASLLVATVPLFMAIIELVKDKKNIGYLGWIGLLIGFAGVAALVFLGDANEKIDPLGCFLLLIGSLSWAIGSVYSKTFKASGSMVTHIGIQMLAGGIGLTIIGILLGEGGRIHFTKSSIGAMAYLIFMGSMAGYGSYIYVLQKWPSAKAGTYAYVNPLVAVILGNLILNEPISSKVIFSTVIILGGVILVQRSKSPVKIAQEEI